MVCGGPSSVELLQLLLNAQMKGEQLTQNGSQHEHESNYVFLSILDI